LRAELADRPHLIGEPIPPHSMCVAGACRRTIHASLLAYVFCAWYVTFMDGDLQGGVRAPNVGARVREARELLGLSQTALANVLDAGERTVQAWERNERTPRVETLMRLGEKAGRTVAWFYSSDDEREAA
jgi:DNA-binding XRE family transcriptional regulator